MEYFVLVRRWRLFLMVSLAGAGCLIFTARPAMAAANTSWQKAETLKSPLSDQVLYGTFSQAGSSAFYTFTVTRPGTVTIALTVPTWAASRFKPQLVVYQPEQMTVGPVLPMAQPPLTAALVYPSADWAWRFEPATLIEHRLAQETKLILPTAGKYFLAVYNAGSAAGRWRLEFAGRPEFSELLSWPGLWWQDQAWAGWTLRTLFIPLWLGSLVTAVLWLFIHPKKHQLHKRKSR